MVSGKVKSLVITLEPAGAGVLAYVYFKEISPGEAAKTVEIEPSSVLADYDADGQLIGLEFLHAEGADGNLMRKLSKQLHVPELAGLDLAEMCKAAA